MKFLILRRAFELFCLGIFLSPSMGWAERPGLLNAIEEEIAEILENNRSGVVRIHSIHPGRTQGSDGLALGAGFTHGTGFIFDRTGHIVTVEEAVKDAEEIRVTFTSGRQLKASFVASDPVSEVAVIRVKTDLEPLVFENSANVRIGHYAFILGNDFGNLVHSLGSVYEINSEKDLIQVAAKVYPGYGGAPVFCSSGKLGGMVWGVSDPRGTMLRTQGTHSFSGWPEPTTSVFVIPINRVSKIAKRLISDGHMKYGWLGVEVQTSSSGVRVQEMDPRGPANLELREGDVILTFEGRRVGGPYQLRSMVMEGWPGSSVKLGIRRNGSDMIAQVKLGELTPNGIAVTSAEVSPERGNQEVLSQQIYNLEREVGRLRQMLIQNR